MQRNLAIDDWQEKSAVLSADECYRYYLSRQWARDGKKLGFICLNPSTADATVDDPTVRRCVGFARAWGCTKMVIGNLFALRSTDPKILFSEKNPIGLDNDYWLEKIVEECDLVIAAWGTLGNLYGRDVDIKKKFNGRLHALKLTKDFHPSHPLYLSKDLTPFVF